MKIFSNMFSILLLLLCTLFVSCAGVFDVFDGNSSSSNSNTGYVVVKTKSRTVLPNANIDDFTDFELKGNDKVLFSAATLKELTSQQIELETGSYEFKLSAKLNTVAFISEAVSATVSVGQVTPLSFTLSSTANTGSFSLTLEFDGSASKAIAKLLRGGVEISDKNTIFTDLSENSITYAVTDLEAGTYTAEISFFGVDDIQLNTYTELVRIANGYTSTASRSISLNELYSIDYTFLYNGEAEDVLPEGVSLPQAYSRKSEITLPTDITADGYCFGGWYKDADCTQAITSIEKGTTGNKTLYASFVNEIILSSTGESPTGELLRAHKPVNSLSTALLALPSTSINWNILIDGEISGTQTMGQDLISGKTFTVCGKDANAKLSGTLNITTSSTVTLKDIEVNTVTANYNFAISGSTKLGTVSLSENATITIASPLTATGTVATITPASYGIGTKVLEATDGIANSEFSKFAVTLQTLSSDTRKWHIDSNGELYYLGDKSAPNAVGDIVFSDGSATAYSSSMSLPTYKKEKVIALIFYKGTDCNNDGDTTTRTLGVGLKHDKLMWCKQDANAYNIEITTILCPASGDSGALTFTGDKNGSDNLEQIADFDGVSDTDNSENYPAFYFGKNYKTVNGSNVSGSSYEDGWYLPSLAELFQIYACRKNTFDIDVASQALGGDKFGTNYYWSSSQDSAENYWIPELNFGSGGWGRTNKNEKVQVCAIREF